MNWFRKYNPINAVLPILVIFGVCVLTFNGFSIIIKSGEITSFNDSIGKILNLPTPFQVTGSGSYCERSSGVEVGLTSSQSDVVYTLYKNDVIVPPQISGTGDAISFGFQLAGNYTVAGSNFYGTVSMSGNAFITETPLPVVNIKASNNNVCAGTLVTFTAQIQNAPNPTYQWFRYGSPVSTNPTYTRVPTNGEILRVEVSSGGCTGVSENLTMVVFPTYSAVSLMASETQLVAGEEVTLDVETFNAGNQSVIDWYINDIDINYHGTNYTYIPENGDEVYIILEIGGDVPCITQSTLVSNTIALSTCTSGPAIFNIFGGGDYCEPTGYEFYCDGSEPGISYSAYVSYNNERLLVPATETLGSGDTLSFYVELGEFFVRACNACDTVWMNGSALFNIIDPKSTIISSDNNICAGTSVEFNAVPRYQNNTSSIIYTWRVNEEEPISTSDTYTYTPSNGDMITAEMTFPCRDYLLNNKVVMLVRDCPALETTWTGNSSEDWFDAQNWSNGIPTPESFVYINDGIRFPTLTAPAECASIIMGDRASLIGTEFLTVKSAQTERIFGGDQFVFLSSPMTNSLPWDAIFPDQQNSIWIRKYDEFSGNWFNQSKYDFSDLGKGFTVQTIPDRTARFIGNFSNNDVESGLFFNNPGNDPNRAGWNLLGNPFPSPIDWDLVQTNQTERAVYVWDGTQYVSWNGTVGALNNGIIPAMSGFFVKAVNHNFTPLSIPLSARVHQPMLLNFKNGITNVLKVRTYDNVNSDVAFFRLNNEATPGFDYRSDARKLFGIEEAPQLYSSADGIDLSINEFPYFGSQVQVPLLFSGNFVGNYNLSFEELDSFEANIQIVFTDTKENIRFDVKNNRSYRFDYIPGEPANRFKLEFKPAAASPINERLQAYISDKMLVLLNPDGLEGELHLVDLTGKRIFSRSISGDTYQNFAFNQARGIYIVQMITSEGIQNQKISFF